MQIIQIAGRLGRDVETRFTPSGQKVSTMTVAVNIRKAGKEETVWWRVTLWGDRFDKLMPYLTKGHAVIVVGEVGKPEIWTDKDGRPQVSLEITGEIVRFSPFGNPDRKPENANTNASFAGSNNQGSSHGAPSDFGAQSYSSPAGATSPYGGGAYPANAPGHTSQDFQEDPLPF